VAFGFLLGPLSGTGTEAANETTQDLVSWALSGLVERPDHFLDPLPEALVILVSTAFLVLLATSTWTLGIPIDFFSPDGFLVEDLADLVVRKDTSSLASHEVTSLSHLQENL